ncbi:MAG: rhodanese-like domain-containing protein [Flavobacteriaceae bacterium]|nr:rhodanese-like domain-containing protein [Flavobacteriaceae bacterium]
MEELDQIKWSSLLKLNKDSTILDVRTRQEYNIKHIEGSILIDISDPSSFMEMIKKLDRTKKYFVYCGSGVRSSNACKILDSLGFNFTYNLIGGIENWNGKIVSKHV